MKKIIIILFLVLFSCICFASSTITKEVSVYERRTPKVGEVKTFIITQTRSVDVNGLVTDTNNLEGQRSFGGNPDANYPLNGFLYGVFVKTTGGDSNGIPITLKSHTYGITYFSATIWDCNTFYPICSSLNDPNMPHGVPVDGIVDANWRNNDSNIMTIGVLINSASE